MPNVNSVHLIGHVTRDPELARTTSGTAVAKFGLAINRKIGKGDDRKEEVTFVDITAWSQTAELVNQYVRKGDPLYVEGRLSLDTWEDKNGGGKRSKLYVTAERVEFLTRKGEGEGDERGGQQAAPKPAAGQPGRAAYNPDDIPF